MHAAAIASSSARPSTRPVGLCGELISSTRARGPIAARSASSVELELRRSERHRPARGAANAMQAAYES